MSNRRKALLDFLEPLVPAVNTEDLARLIVTRMADALDADLCTLWQRVSQNGTDKLILIGSVGFDRQPGEEIPTYELNWDAADNREIEGVTAWIAIRGCLCRANSFDELARNPKAPWFGSHRGHWDNLQFMAGNPQRSFRSLLGVPLLYGRDKLVGLIKIENKRSAGGFTRADESFVSELAPHLAMCLASMQEHEKSVRRRQEVLKSLTEALPRLDPTKFHQVVVNKTAQLLNADVCSLWLVSEDGSKMVLGANYGVVMPVDSGGPEYRLDRQAGSDEEIDGLTAWVAIRKRPFFATKFEDLKQCRAHKGKWDEVQWRGSAGSNFGCLYAVPLVREDRTIGVLKIENSRGKHIFDDVDKATFSVMADFIALAVELSGRLHAQVVFDFLHLLKEPTSNSIMAFDTLRAELSQPEPRPNRIQSRLEMMARNLQSVQTWAMHAYGLATGREHSPGPPHEVRLQDLLQEVGDEIRRLFPDFSCTFSPGLEDCTVHLTPLDRRKAIVIFFNILDNSYKHSSADRKHIQVRLSREASALRISVQDQGFGIPAQDLPRIFEPYFSNPQGERSQSTGLGLSTVRRLIDDLGWSHEVRSEPGKGTCFSVIIPRLEQLEARR